MSIYSDADVVRWRRKVILRSCSQLNQSRELYLIEINAFTILFTHLMLLLLYLLFMLLILVKLYSYDLLYAGSWQFERDLDQSWLKLSTKLRSILIQYLDKTSINLNSRSFQNLHKTLINLAQDFNKIRMNFNLKSF